MSPNLSIQMSNIYLKLTRPQLPFQVFPHKASPISLNGTLGQTPGVVFDSFLSFMGCIQTITSYPECALFLFIKHIHSFSRSILIWIQLSLLAPLRGSRLSGRLHMCGGLMVMTTHGSDVIIVTWWKGKCSLREMLLPERRWGNAAPSPDLGHCPECSPLPWPWSTSQGHTEGWNRSHRSIFSGWEWFGSPHFCNRIKCICFLSLVITIFISSLKMLL